MSEITIVEPKGTLIDYAATNAGDPSLFGHIPTFEALSRLHDGMCVKIGLEPGATWVARTHAEIAEAAALSPHPEHFWVRIVARQGVQGFVGRVRNDIQAKYRLRLDDHLVFAGHNIIEIED